MTCESSAWHFGFHVFIAALTLVAVHPARAQSGDNPYGGTMPYYQSMGSYSSAYSFSSTAFEGAQRGRAALVEAAGDFQLRQSQAAILWQQARAMDRENDLEQTVALQTQRELWQEGREAARKAREARAAQRKLALEARRTAEYKHAYSLSADELNPNTGEISWPAALWADKYERERLRVEELFRSLLTYADSNSQTAEEIGRQVDALIQSLRSDVRVLPRKEYLAAQKFLRGLKYAAAG